MFGIYNCHIQRHQFVRSTDVINPTSTIWLEIEFQI